MGNSDNIPLILGIIGVATAFLAIGLAVGFILTGNTQRQSSGGYSLTRDDRGRILDIMPIPIPTMGEMY